MHGMRLMKYLVLVLVATAALADGKKSVYDMTFEELGDLRVVSGASLTRTEARKIPASVTVITSEMIENSERNTGAVR